MRVDIGGGREVAVPFHSCICFMGTPLASRRFVFLPPLCGRAPAFRCAGSARREYPRASAERAPGFSSPLGCQLGWKQAALSVHHGIYCRLERYYLQRISLIPMCLPSTIYRLATNLMEHLFALFEDDRRGGQGILPQLLCKVCYLDIIQRYAALLHEPAALALGLD